MEVKGFIIPALDAAKTVGQVVEELRQELARQELSAQVLVIDDGSTDETSTAARVAGAEVLRHPTNRGKGAALVSGMTWAIERGLTQVVSLDADGQHPGDEAVRLLLHQTREPCLVLAVRDLAAAGAPQKNQRSNAFSNLVLSWMGGQRLLDTQCGLRRYPVAETLALGSPATGFAFESDVVLRAARRGLAIAHVPTRVIYPPEEQRVTHFDNLRDPTKIVLRVVATTLTTPHHRFWRRWFKRAVLLLLLLGTLVVSTHQAVVLSSRMRPPQVRPEPQALVREGSVRRVGRATASQRQGIWEVHLRGSAEEIGWAHGKLLRDRMLENEGALYRAFDRQVPSVWMRTLVFDLARLGYRDIDEGFRPERRRELAAQALAFLPDPFEDRFPTYQRFVYLHALYDISLSFEHSPLLGCTTFTVPAPRSRSGSPLLGRAFDFEVDAIFDQDKAVFFIEESGKIPFASVAWPGLIGVVSGMNRAGLALVVHGARAGPTQTTGEPVVHTLRHLLSNASSTAQALALLQDAEPMVSHLVILQDAEGDARVVERAVSHPLHIRPLPDLAAVSNHLEGPLAADPKNERVRRTTSTLARRARGDALVAQAGPRVGPEEVLAWLRDQNAADGTPLPPGDRLAIDAGIATHAVIASTQERKLWVSRGPHLLGEFVEYDLDQVFLEPARPSSQDRPTLPADPRPLSAPNPARE